MPRGGQSYAERRKKPREQRDRQAAASSQNEAEGSDATEEEATGERTTGVGRPRGGMKVAARIGEGLRREIGKEEADSQGWATASTTLLSLKSLCGGGVPSSHPSLGLSVFFLSFALQVLQVLLCHYGGACVHLCVGGTCYVTQVAQVCCFFFM